MLSESHLVSIQLSTISVICWFVYRFKKCLNGEVSTTYGEWHVYFT